MAVTVVVTARLRRGYGVGICKNCTKIVPVARMAAASVPKVAEKLSAAGVSSEKKRGGYGGGVTVIDRRRQENCRRRKLLKSFTGEKKSVN